MPENPYESPKTTSASAKSSGAFSTITKVVLFLGVIGLLIALLIPATRSARPASRQNICLSQIKQIALALHNYESTHGTLPPAYTVDENGNRLHSWRTLILPYMEEQPLYDRIDLTKPWDDPANAEAHDAVLEFYACPSQSLPPGQTTYLAVTGPECVFPGSKGIPWSDVTDGTSRTIAVIDAPMDKAVHWMSPHDIGIDGILAIDEDSPHAHPGVLAVAMLDGSCQTIPLDTDRKELRAMLTIAGDETTDADE